MQTFLPYPSFTASAACLDNKRLGKQRVEAFQILKAMYEGGRWTNHPAFKMWNGYYQAITLYKDCCIAEWIKRGFNNTMHRFFYKRFDEIQSVIPVPEWLGNESFHAAHRSNLLRKLPSHYRQFGWTEPNDLPYVWPIR